MSRLSLLLLLVPGLAFGGTYGGVTKPTRDGDRTETRTRRYVPPPNPWDFDPTVVAELGGGLSTGIPGGTGMARGRWDQIGLGVTSTFLTDGSGWLSESDAGPVIYLDASDDVEIGLQPSVLVAAADGLSPQLGAGVRAYGTAELGDRFLVQVDPMVGRLDEAWQLHLRAGAGYRFTPNVYGRVSYDARDDIGGDRPLAHGVFGTVGLRF